MLLTTSAFADDIYYCRGGLVGVGDWAQSTLYPLTKGEDGIYNRENEMCIFSKRNVHFLYFFSRFPSSFLMGF